jgi:hypothetical protein
MRVFNTDFMTTLSLPLAHLTKLGLSQGDIVV